MSTLLTHDVMPNSSNELGKPVHAFLKCSAYVESDVISEVDIIFKTVLPHEEGKTIEKPISVTCKAHLYC